MVGHLITRQDLKDFEDMSFLQACIIDIDLDVRDDGTWFVHDQGTVLKEGFQTYEEAFDYIRSIKPL